MKFLILGMLFMSQVLSQSESPLVHCETTKGPLTIEVHPEWAPLGAKRFLDLVQDEFYTDIAFFRCVKRFLTQFGISENPAKKHWHYEEIPDDPNLNLGIQKNYVSFAGGGPNTRSTQIFIAFEYLDFLGKEPWETPFAVVIDGQSTLDNLYKGYGDIPPFGKGPDQQKIHNRGNAYIRENFPNTDFLLHCEMVVKDPPVVAIQPPSEPEPAREEEPVVRKESRLIRTRAPDPEEAKAVPPVLVDTPDKPVVSVEGLPEGEAVADVTKEPEVAHTDQDLMLTSIAFLISLFLMLYIYLQCVNPTNASVKAQKFDQ